MTTPTQSENCTTTAKATPVRATPLTSRSPRNGVFACTSSPVITVFVGPKKIPFVIHKSLLCECSPYFSAALDGQFQEAKEHKIYFEDEDPKIFKIFTGWLYTGRLLDIVEGTDSLGHLDLTDACWLWIFADKVRIIKLKNLAVDLYHQISVARRGEGRGSSGSVPSLSYSNTVEGSPLRRLVVRYYASYVDLTVFPARAGQYPEAFLLDLLSFCHIREMCNWRKNWADLNLTQFYVTEDAAIGTEDKNGAMDSVE